MILVGHTELFENYPTFSMMLFADSNNESHSNYYAQKIDCLNDVITDFIPIQINPAKIYSIRGNQKFNVGAMPIYGIHLEERDFLYGTKGQLNSLVSDEIIQEMPVSLQMQFYDVIGKKDKKLSAQRILSEKLIKQNKISEAKSLLNSSISLSGWSHLEAFQNKTSTRFGLNQNRLADFHFYLDEKNEIKFFNFSDDTEIDRTIIDSVLDLLRVDFEPLTNMFSEEKLLVTSEYETKSISSDTIDESAVHKRINFILRHFGRQEDRIALVLVFLYLYPEIGGVILNYSDRAQSGSMAMNVLSSYYISNSINSLSPSDVPRVISIIDRKWITGERYEFYTSLTKWFFFVDEEVFNLVVAESRRKYRGPDYHFIDETAKILRRRQKEEKLNFPLLMEFLTLNLMDLNHLFHGLSYSFEMASATAFQHWMKIDKS